MTFFSMSLTEKNAKMKNTLEHFFFSVGKHSFTYLEKVATSIKQYFILN